MRTAIRLVAILSLLVPVAACSKAPVTKTTPSSASAKAAKAKPVTKKSTTRPADTEGEAGIAVTGPDADKAPPSGPIFFEFDSATLTMASREILSTLASWLDKHEAKLRIEGHTDERGTTEYNLALGDRRARAIADYLAALGVDPARLDTVSYGEEQPAEAGHGEDAWSANRRGELETQ